jgi:hypothetical protein
MSGRKEESAAIVTIKRAADMSAKGRRDIARWLRRQAMFLERHAKELSPRFTARYLYRS